MFSILPRWKDTWLLQELSIKPPSIALSFLGGIQNTQFASTFPLHCVPVQRLFLSARYSVIDYWDDWSLRFLRNRAAPEEWKASAKEEKITQTQNMLAFRTGRLVGAYPTYSTPPGWCISDDFLIYDWLYIRAVRSATHMHRHTHTPELLISLGIWVLAFFPAHHRKMQCCWRAEISNQVSHITDWCAREIHWLVKHRCGAVWGQEKTSKPFERSCSIFHCRCYLWRISTESVYIRDTGTHRHGKNG